MEARVNSKTAQLRENGTEIVHLFALFARFALGASFLSALADRFGLWGPHGAKNVSWGNFAHFVEYTGAVIRQNLSTVEKTVKRESSRVRVELLKRPDRAKREVKRPV